MLVIRLQRTGRKGYAQYRVVVQDSRTSPTSGRVVAAIGTYDPHTKEVKMDKEKASLYIKNGAKPSSRIALLLKAEGVKLPAWAKVAKSKKKRLIKNTEKLRKNRPVEAKASADKPVDAEPAKEEAETPKAEAQTAAEEVAEEPKAEETPAPDQEPAK